MTKAEILERFDLTRWLKKEEAVIYEMAGKVPGRAKFINDPKKDGLIIAVGADEKIEPHFHIFRTDIDCRNWRNGAVLLINDNRYFDHGKNRETLTRSELKAVVEKLKSKVPDEDLDITCWRYLISLWNNNNDRYQVPNNIQMPEYDFDTITRYKG